ncbi:MAG: hypothetical protein M0022_08095 [Desulfobacteraceae bacterium]|nr:hypothetical protein [Desulfobacteraceae bacterium]
MNHNYKKKVIPGGLICLTVFILTATISTPAARAAMHEQLIAVLPVNTDKANEFSYLSQAIEQALDSRLYKPGIINVVNPLKIKKVFDSSGRPISGGSLADAVKGVGAGYFITGKVSMNGKAPGLNLELIRVGTSGPVTSLSVKNAVSDNILQKIDGFVANVADAVITGPPVPVQAQTEETQQPAVAYAAGQKQEPQASQSKRIKKNENEAITTARVNPDLLFYKELGQLKNQKGKSNTTSSEKLKKEAVELEKSRKEAYENMLPYPIPPDDTKTEKADNNENKQLASKLRGAFKKAPIKLPKSSYGKAVPYPTPEELETADKKNMAKSQAEEKMASIPSKNSDQELAKLPPAQESAPQATETQTSSHVVERTPSEAPSSPKVKEKQGWLAWIMSPFKTEDSGKNKTVAIQQAQALNQTSKIEKEGSGARRTAEENTGNGHEAAAPSTGGPIWQWY